jgi:predicted lipoprotein with Yx(FWY)xxD motif
MRQSGWAAAAGIGSLVLLLTACGGLPDSTPAASPASHTARASEPGSAPATASSAASPAATSSRRATSKKAGTGNSSSSSVPEARSHTSAGPQPSGGAVVFPTVGTTVMTVQHSSIGWVMAEADGQVVYTYGQDKKGGAPACTGSCATQRPPATGTPKAGPADRFPGSFGVVKGSGGVEQITYNGYPLYTLAGASPLMVGGNGGGWHVVPLSRSDIGN